MATVYKAVQKGAAGFQRTVAIKHIKPEYRALKNYIDMFIEEARVGSELQHPNIVQVHDFVSQNGSYYLVMEWVEGIDLGAFIRINKEAGTPISWPFAVAMGIGTLRGLGAAHTRIAPEVTFGRPISPQSDLYGVGNVIWESLAGERLFDGKNDVEIFKKIRAAKVPPIVERRPDVPPAF